LVIYAMNSVHNGLDVQALNLSTVDLNLLVVFDTILAERSVSRAAERLHLTQSAVSHALTRLRVIMDDELFIRAPTGMLPTALAAAISGRVRAALREIQGVLTREDAFDPAKSTHRFTLGMTDYVALLHMPALARRLQQGAPEVRLVVLPANWRSSAGMLERSEIDLYIGAGMPDPPSFLARAELYADESVCVARRGHPAFARRLTAARLLACDHLHVSPWGEPGYIDEMLSRQRSSRRIAMTVGHFLLAPAILEHTDLVAVLPKRVVTLLARRYRLTVQSSPFDLGVTQIVQTWHRRYDADAGLRWLRGQIAAGADSSP
jgi:DNA-binding transcriptional LysR family regulator